MNTRTLRGWMIIMAIWLLALSCNMPVATPQSTSEPTLSSQDIAATAVSVALTERADNEAASPTSQPPPPQATNAPLATSTNVPTATQCVATVTANTDVNIRTGPATAYDIVGYLPSGGTARVAGRSVDGTWWYIEFAGGPGGHAWIAGSVTTAACIPAALQVVAAPPLPTATFTPTIVALPDLYVSEYEWSPVPPHMGVSFHIRIGIYNQGDTAAGAIHVQWWLSIHAPSPACTWNIPSMAAHGGRILECDYIPAGWANYPSRVVADSSNMVLESDEGNNTRSAILQIQP